MITSAVALLALTGCPDDGPPNVGPTIVSFEADATMVAAGSQVTLSWTVDDATTITLLDGANALVSDANATDSFTVTVDATTTYRLEASNDFGDTSDTLTVTVMGDNNNPPTVDAFTANPSTIDAGQSATLSWMTTNATAVDVMEGTNSVVTDGDANGNVTVMPTQTTTYTIVAKGAGGMTAMGMVTVTVNGPMGPSIMSFTVNPMAIDEGDSATLSWNVMNADTVAITDADGAMIYSGADNMGTQMVMPTQTTTYSLTVTNANGSDSRDVTLTVNPLMGASIQAFTANPSTVMFGQSSDLSWTVMNATSVEIMAGGAVLNTSAMQTGMFTVTPTVTTEYTLMARNTNGDAMAMTTVMVSASAPIINNFAAAPNPLAVNSTVTLSWDVLGADTIRVLDGTTELANSTMAMGSVDVTVTSTLTTYSLEATNMTGGNMGMVTVYGHLPAVINSFTATPMGFSGSATVTLSWDTANVQNLGIMMNGQPLAGFTPIANPMATTDEVGTFQVLVTADTTFTLNVDSVAGNASATATALQVVAEMEPNDTPQTAGGPLTNPVNGTIGGGGEDIDFYTVVVPAGGWVRAETSDGMGACGLDTVLDLYAPDGTTRLETNDDGGTGVCSLIDPTIDPGARNLAAGTYYVAVTAFAGGAYQLAVTTGGPACGNAIQETGESCDDGNNVNGDGCDSACQLEPVNVYTAPGAPMTFADAINPVGEQDYYRIDVTAAALVTIETFVDATAGTCAGADTVIRLYDSSLTLLGSDDEGGVSSCSRIDPQADSFAQLAPGTYWLRVEDFLNNTAIPAYEIVFTSIAGNVCGNGVVEAANGEICDDGNVMPGDGCNATCQPEVLLDYMAPGPVATASSAITVATQVDTIRITATSSVYIAAEILEDAAQGTCDNIDTRMRLLDSTGTELGNDDFDGVGSCSLIDPNGDSWARVGPGTYFLTIEEDGRNATIPSYTVGVIGLPVDICGNGVLETGLNEQCDDGNTTPGDGCNATCQFEPIAVHTAPGAPTVVTARALALGQQDLYQITVSAEAWVEVQTFTDITTQACSGSDLFARLLDSTFTEIATDDDGGVGLCSAFVAGTDPFTRMMPGTYYVIVEELGRNSAVPSYDIGIASVPVDICGNGIVDGMGEVCDDGNVVNGDGCSSTCQPEGMVLAETEPNGDINTSNASGLNALGSVTVSGNISAAGDQDFFSFVVPAGGADLTAITYTTVGNTATCASGTDTRIYLQDSAGVDIANNDDGNPAGTGLCSLLTQTGLAAGTYHIRVQHWNNTGGPFPYFMDITLQ